MKIKYLIYTLFLFIGLTSCGDKDDVPKPEPLKRTVLVYMVASNLGGSLQNNIDDMIYSATAENLNGGHLIVFYSKSKNEAELFEIKEGANGIVTRHHIRDYTDQSAISPDVMRMILRETFTEFSADSYGLVLSSHGTAWFPTRYTSMLRSFGEESGENMEIYELKEALLGFDLDFILFDACSMGGIEVVYELKDRAEYIIASPSEIISTGFPYKTVIPYLFKESADLANVALAFDTFYQAYHQPYGNIAVIKTSELNKLAEITKEIISEAGIEAIYSLPLSTIQVLSNLSSSSTPLYDFRSVIKLLATEEQLVRFDAILNSAITDLYTTKNVYCSGNGITLVNEYSGLSFYPLKEQYPTLNEWYRQNTDWYKAVYE